MVLIGDQPIFRHLCLSSPPPSCVFSALSVSMETRTPPLTTFSVQGLLDLPFCPPSLPPSNRSSISPTDPTSSLGEQHVEPSRKAESKHCTPSCSHGELAALSEAFPCGDICYTPAVVRGEGVESD